MCVIFKGTILDPNVIIYNKTYLCISKITFQLLNVEDANANAVRAIH